MTGLNIASAILALIFTVPFAFHFFINWRKIPAKKAAKNAFGEGFFGYAFLLMLAVTIVERTINSLKFKKIKI